MTERMSSADVAVLSRETRTTPQHVGHLAIFTEPPVGFDYDRLVRLLEERVTLAPRYRQKVRSVPGHLANPVWVDDPRFDISYHVRRSALPRPGSDVQLLEFCARIQARMLDRSRPLWEIYLVEGLSGGRIAIVTKTHEAMVSEPHGIDLLQVVLDASPAPRRSVEPIWMPEPEPGAAALIRDALVEIARRPIAVTDTARAAARDIGATAARASALFRGVLATGQALFRSAPPSALHAGPGEHRRLAVARTSLDPYREVRAAFDGTVNDVVLAVITGALRSWLRGRSTRLQRATSVRALVPITVRVDPEAADGRQRVATTRRAAVRPFLLDLPVGEPDPVLRLAQLRYAMATHQASGRAISAAQLARWRGLAAPTLHALGARAANNLSRRLFDVAITNVPGPQLPLYAAGARMSEMFPILPLASGQALSIALTSYDGGVYYGLNGDRDAMADIVSVAQLIEESLAELVAAARTARTPTTARRVRRS